MGRGWELTDFQPHRAGIIEVWRSQGMQDALREVADAKVEEANAAARLHGTTKVPPYAGGVDVLDRTAVGYVTTRTRLGAIDQSAHHTLDAINH